MIIQLDENTISKIAAGEVIERPLNIVKELLENSIDAGATRIIVEIEDGGLDKIVITDNGSGIDKNDLGLAFVSHATSKINNIDDILDVKSFGFRGEALSSIGIASKVSIISKTADSKVGYIVEDNFGEISDIKETASSDGTKVIVSNLFDNMPVRKKFLKSGSVEASRIYDIVEKIALSHQDISFKYIQDGVEKFSTSGDNNLKNIIYTLYGKSVYENVLDVNSNINGIKIVGVIGNTSVTRNNRNDEIIFVNNRYVKSALLTKALEEAFKPYLMQHKFPLAVLNVIVTNGLVDVNIHPQKLDVRFSDESKIYTAMFDSVSNVLSNASLIHHEHIDDSIVEFNDNKNSIIEPKPYKAVEINIDDIKSYKETKESNDNANKIDDNIKAISNDNLKQQNLFDELLNNGSELIKDTLSKNEYHYIGQLFKTYILVEYNNKFYIIDQHAAHEKIYYEKFMKELNSQDVISQKIMPLVITLNSIQHQVLEENVMYFKKAGFDIDFFGERDIIVNSVPFNILDIGKKELLLEMIDDFSKNKSLAGYDSINDKIATIACKKAVKGNNVLLDVEAKQLIDDLFSLENPYNCPHGRPTIIEFSKYEIEKKFGRIV